MDDDLEVHEDYVGMYVTAISNAKSNNQRLTFTTRFEIEDCCYDGAAVMQG